jgi:hypothetical protein
MKIPTMPDRTVIGAEIKRLKEAKNISVVDLGRAIRKPRQTVYNIMDGNASYDLLKLTLDTLDRWDTPNHLGHIFGDVKSQLEDL